MLVTEFKPKGEMVIITFKDLGNIEEYINRKHADQKGVVFDYSEPEKINIDKEEEVSDPLPKNVKAITFWVNRKNNKIDIGYLKGRTFWVLITDNLLFKLKSFDESIKCHLSTKYKSLVKDIICM